MSLRFNPSTSELDLVMQQSLITNLYTDEADYTITASDNGKALYWQTTLPHTVTLPDGLPEGMYFYLINAGMDTITITSSQGDLPVNPKQVLLVSKVTSDLVAPDTYSSILIPDASSIPSPGGSDTQVQFNDGGVFGGDSNLLWDKSNDRLGIGVSPNAKLEIKPTTANGSTVLRVDNSSGTGKFTVDDGGTAVFDAAVSGNLGFGINFKWLTYSPDANVYMRDLVNARMQLYLQPGSTTSLALTTISSRLTVEDNVVSNGTVSTTAGGAAGVGTQALTTGLYVQSRLQNLITNGNGLLLNNYNFSSLTFDSTQLHGGAGSFLKNAAFGAYFNDEAIPVDPEKNYRLVAWGRSGEAGGTNFNVANQQYLGVATFDIDGAAIVPTYYAKYPGSTDTTLAAQLNPGDTTITLTNATGWHNGATYHQRNFIWYGYANSKGYTYPDYTYSRTDASPYTADFYPNGIWAAAGISGNVITLRVPWAGPTLAAGRAVRNTSDGGTFKYIAAVGAVVPNDWTRYEGYIGGLDTDADQNQNEFPYGTAYVRLIFLVNYHGSADNNIRWSDIWFSELSTKNLEFSTTTPTAYIHLKAGTATVSTAPLKLTSGTKLTTAEAGAHEYNGNHLLTNGSIRFPVGGVLFDHYASVNNATTTETDLYTDTLAASTLANNGDKVEASYQITCAGAVAATQEMRVYFGGTLIYDTGALSLGAITANFTFTVNVIRESSTVVRCWTEVSTDFATLFPYSKYTRVTGLTLSSTNIIKITGQAAGAGAASNQITSTAGYVEFKPGS